MTRYLFWPTLGLLLLTGIVVGLTRGCGSGRTRPLVEGPVRVIADTVLIASRPQVVTRWRDRIIVKTVPARVAVSEGVPDTAWAMRYARSAIRADSIRRAQARGDSIARLPGPILPPATGHYDGSELTLWLTRSDGSLMRATARLKPRFSFYAGTDAGSDTLPIFQSDRWFVRLARQTVKCAPSVGVIAVLGALVHPNDRVLGAVGIGSAALVGCLSG